MTGQPQEGAHWWFAFRSGELLVHQSEDGVRIPTAEDFPPDSTAAQAPHYVGSHEGRSCVVVPWTGSQVRPEGTVFLGLRSLYGKVPVELYRLAGRAFQLLEWKRTHRYCGNCGTPTALKADEGALECPACGALFFPRISPAVIVLVRDGDRALLARSHNFPPGRYSTIAGFVEPGETLEEAVEREVAEEVGVHLTNVRYFGSQPWPFPHSLMVGFTAAYAGGEIRLQEKEIADAGWFQVNSLPDLPPPPSIARQLIDWFIAECNGSRA